VRRASEASGLSDIEMHSFLTLAISIALLPVSCALVVTAGRADKAARILQADGSAELLQLGNELRLPGELDKVKEMISHMIAQHQSRQADDTDHKSFCDKEMTASKAKVVKLKNDLQKRTADNDLHSAQLAELKDTIGDLHESVAKAQKDKMKAADIRSQEAAQYKKNKIEWETSLQAFKRSARSDIRSVRQAAIKGEEELSLKQVRAENAEEDAQFRYKKLDEDMAVAIARKTKEAELKERKVVSMNHELSLGDGDFKMTQDEMAAAKEYAEKINGSCINRQDPAKERKADRERQIASLKNAYQVIQGEAIP